MGFGFKNICHGQYPNNNFNTLPQKEMDKNVAGFRACRFQIIIIFITFL